MEKTLLIATHNPAKVHDLQQLLSDLPLHFVSLADVGITEDVEENGKTYQENAEKKALFYAKISNLPAVADDGGLEIAALNGEPGLKSHRWLGPNTTYDDLMKHMEKVASSLPENKRDASFKLVVAFALPDGQVWSAKGDAKGIIAPRPSPQKIHGFPYRSYFYFPEIRKFYFESEMTPEEMKIYNHRYKALEKLKPLIRKQMGLF